LFALAEQQARKNQHFERFYKRRHRMQHCSLEQQREQRWCMPSAQIFAL